MSEKSSYPDQYKHWQPTGYWIDRLTEKFEEFSPIGNPDEQAQSGWLLYMGFVASKMLEGNPVGIPPIISADGKREIVYSQNCTDSARLKIRLCELLGVDVYGVVNKVGESGHATLIVDFGNRFWELSNMAALFSAISSDHIDALRTDQYGEKMWQLLTDIKAADGAYMWKNSDGIYDYQLVEGDTVRSQSPIEDKSMERGVFIAQPSLAYDVMQAGTILKHFYEHQQTNPTYFEAAKLALRELIPKLSSQKDSVNA